MLCESGWILNIGVKLKNLIDSCLYGLRRVVVKQSKLTICKTSTVWLKPENFAVATIVTIVSFAAALCATICWWWHVAPDEIGVTTNCYDFLIFRHVSVQVEVHWFWLFCVFIRCCLLMNTISASFVCKLVRPLLFCCCCCCCRLAPLDTTSWRPEPWSPPSSFCFCLSLRLTPQCGIVGDDDAH